MPAPTPIPACAARGNGVCEGVEVVFWDAISVGKGTDVVMVAVIVFPAAFVVVRIELFAIDVVLKNS